MVYEKLRHQLQHLLPVTCLCCGAPGVAGLDICPGCYRDLPANRPACAVCGLPVPAHSRICGQCQQQESAIGRTVAPWLYQPPVDGLIQDLKFHGKLPAGRLLGAMLARCAAIRASPAEAIVPLPLHHRRLRERGFNQAAEIARPLARELGIPLRTGWLRRPTATGPQARLDRDERRHNIRGVFRAEPDVRGRRIALLDDVVTTGSTVEEAARALRLAGAREVEVWAVARAVLNR